MLILFPLSGSSALAATISLQMSDSCSAKVMPVIQHQPAGLVHKTVTSQIQHGKSCDSNGTCHFACIGYLATPPQDLTALQLEMQPVTPYLVSFTSITSAPLNPPPLA